MCTGLSEKKAAKLSEFGLDFPKLADWLCMGWSVCQAAAKAGNSNRGFFLQQPVELRQHGRLNFTLILISVARARDQVLDVAEEEVQSALWSESCRGELET